MSLLTLDAFFGDGWELAAVDEEALPKRELVADLAGDDGPCSRAASCDAMIAGMMEAAGSQKADQSREAGNAQSQTCKSF